VTVTSKCRRPEGTPAPAAPESHCTHRSGGIQGTHCCCGSRPAGSRVATCQPATTALTSHQITHAIVISSVETSVCSSSPFTSGH
jgi:hypothetical protein